MFPQTEKGNKMTNTLEQSKIEEIKSVFLSKGISLVGFEKMLAYYKKYTNATFAMVDAKTIERRLDVIITSLKELGLNEDDIDACFSKHAAFYFQNQDKVKERICENATVYGMSVPQFIELGVKMPQLFTLRTERLTKNMNDMLDILKINKSEYIKLGLKQPSLFCYNAETIMEKAEKVAKELKIKPKDFYAMGLRAPTVLCLSTDVILNNINALSEVLNISKEKVLQYPVKRQPSLLYLSTDFVKNTLKKNAKAIGVSVEDLAKLGVKVPNLLYQKTETLIQNVNRLGELLDVSNDAIVKASLRVGNILCLKPETLNANIEQTAALLNLSKQSMVKAALCVPSLFYQKPETIHKNIDVVCRLTGIEKSVYIQAALKHPALFYSNPYNQFKKINFYRQMHKKGLMSVSGENTTEQFMDRMLKVPAKLMYSMEHLHLRCAYARLICETTGTAGIQAVDKSKEQIITALKTAPESFKKRNPVAMRLLDMDKCKG